MLSLPALRISRIPSLSLRSLALASVPVENSIPSSELNSELNSNSNPSPAPNTDPLPSATPPKHPRQRLRLRRGQSAPVFPRAIPAGLNHVYDQALRLIAQDSRQLRREIASLHPTLLQAKKDNNPDLAKKLSEKLNILEIQSQINTPRVRWKFIRGLGNMLKPVYRHLAEQKWRKDGDLDLVMERIYQMHIVPDLLPAIHPSLDLRVLYNEPPPKSLYLRTRTRRRQAPVQAGSFLLPEQTRRPPVLYVTAFHVEPRYYTLIMVDPDCPDPQNQSFKTYLHWIQPNIKLNCQTRRLDTQPLTYIPPHPQKGSPYHRYTILLFQNPQGKEIKCEPESYLAHRDTFNVRQFCSTHGLSLDKDGPGGAVFMWRQLWSETVSHIYKHTLKLPEPHYGRVPEFDMYSEVKEMQKYI